MDDKKNLGGVEEAKAPEGKNNITPKDFVDTLRRKFHDANKDTTLKQLEGVNAKLKVVANKIGELFGEDSAKIFALLNELPAAQIEDFSKYGAEFIQENSKDIKDDINTLGEQKIKTGYITLLLDFLQRKKGEQANKQEEHVKTQEEHSKQQLDNKNETKDETKEISHDKISENVKKYEQAMKDKEAVQKDPAIAQHFNTPEYKQRKLKATEELQGRPGFKAAVQAKFGKDIPAAELADLVVTRQVIQENNLKTPSTASFVKSFDALDDVLHFGSYKAGEFGKNENVLHNQSYGNIINKPGAKETIRQDFSSPEAKTKTMEILNKTKPGLVNNEFLDKYNNAAMTRNDDEMKKLQNENPEAFAEIHKVQSILTDFLTKAARVESVKAYNQFIGGLFNAPMNGKDGANIVSINTSDDKLILSEDGIRFDFNIQGTDCKFEAKDGKVYMANLLRKNQQTNLFSIGNDEIPLPEGVIIPSVGDIIREVNSEIENGGVLDLLDNVNSLDDLTTKYPEIRKKIQSKTEAIIDKFSNKEKNNDVTGVIGEYVQKYYQSSKLVSFYVPPQYEYRIENQNNPTVDSKNVSQTNFYDYLDILRNTFYDPKNNVDAKQMSEFTNKLEGLFESKKVKPQDFFAQFKNSPGEGGFEFLKVRPGTNMTYIDLDEFDRYVKGVEGDRASVTY